MRPRTLTCYRTVVKGKSLQDVFQALLNWLQEEEEIKHSLLALSWDTDVEGEILTIFWE